MPDSIKNDNKGLKGMYGVFFTLSPVVSFEVVLKEFTGVEADFQEVDMLLLKNWMVCKDLKEIEERAIEIIQEHETDVSAYYFDAEKSDFILQYFCWEDVKNGK